MTIKELTKRVEALEAALAELRAKQEPAANGQPPSNQELAPNGQPPWWEAEVGRFANDPVFDEIVRLGREYREGQHPDKKRKPKATCRGHS